MINVADRPPCLTRYDRVFVNKELKISSSSSSELLYRYYYLWLQNIIGVLARKNVDILPYGRPRSKVLLDPIAVLMYKGALSAFLVSFNKRVFLLLSLHPKGADSERGLHCTQNLRLLLQFLSMIWWWWTWRRLKHQARAILAMSSDFRETRLVFPRERNIYYVFFIIGTIVVAVIGVVFHGDELKMMMELFWLQCRSSSTVCRI